MKNLIIIKVIFLIFFLTKIAFAENLQLKVNGNQNIDVEVIKSLIDYENSQNQELDINNLIKKLYETGYFENVEINIDDEILNIIVQEYPIVREIEYVGNKRFKKEQLSKIVYEGDDVLFYNEKFKNSIILNLRNAYYQFGYNQIKIDLEKLDSSSLQFADLKINLNEGQISKINKIFFKGNTVNRNVLIDQIKSNEFNFLKFYSNTNFKRFQIENDKIRLINFYRSQGYKNISIDYNIEYLESNNKFDVYFNISEGKEFIIDNIDLEISSDLFVSDPDIKNVINNHFKQSSIRYFKKKKKYNNENIETFKNNFSEFLFSTGTNYFEIVTLEKEQDNLVDIKFLIKSANTLYVKQINFIGNYRTNDSVMRREMLFSEGDPITRNLIKQSVKNLKTLGLFKSVSYEETTLSSDEINIDILVEETDTGSFQFGLTFGTIQGGSVLISLNEKNIGGTGRGVNFSIDTSEKNTLYSFKIKEPHFLNSTAKFIYGASYNNKDLSSSSSYKYDNLNFNFGINYKLVSDLSHSIILNYNLKDYTITDASKVDSTIKDNAGNNAYLTLENLFVLNNLDSNYFPTSGNLISYSNVISPITNSTNGYIKNLLVLRNYFKFKKSLFSIQSKFGNISSLQDDKILVDDKYSLGGYWLRGFDLNGAGPRNSYTSYVGGNNIIATKLDYLIPFNRLSDNPFYFNTFFDAGQVWGNKENPTNSTESIRASYGFGLKFFTPVGPIGFTWGYPLSDESYDINRMFLFSIGSLN